MPKSKKILSDPIKTEWWPLAKIKPYPGNPRKRSKHSVAKIAASIKAFGWRQPIVVDEKGEILVGHGRRDAAELNGENQAPVHQALGLSAAQKRAFRIADNRTNEETEWDDDLLAVELKGLEGLKFDLSLTGFDLRQVGSYTRSGPVDGEDDVPPVPKKPVTKRGDLWLLGEHRLLCGDATSAEDVGRLLGKDSPAVMVTDPPYGVELDGEWRDRAGANGLGPAEPNYMRSRDGIDGHTASSVSSDTRADWSDAFALVPSLEVAYVWHASSFTTEVLAGLLRIGFLYPQQIIWDKGVAVLTRTHYWFQHEPCWYVRKKNAPWHGSAGQPTVWKAASPKFIMGGSTEEKWDHPTQKPVELMRRSIENHTSRGDVVYEPFGGSGTTLTAAESIGRRCVGLEVDPKYCDVIIARWEKFTGKKAKRG